MRRCNAVPVLCVLAVLAHCSAAPGTEVSGHGFVELDASVYNRIVGLETTLTVPVTPPQYGTLFLWPGLQPLESGVHYDPIGNGVLQPVLAWGGSCAPGLQPPRYSTWWISGQYFDRSGQDPAHDGCYGGPIMSVAVGESLHLTLTLSGSVWTQTIVGPGGAAPTSVTFDEDLMGQAQNRALFVIEGYSCAPASDVVFTDTTITFASPSPGDCSVVQRGIDDTVSTPEPTAGGTSCFIKEIVLRAGATPPR